MEVKAVMMSQDSLITALVERYKGLSIESADHVLAYAKMLSMPNQHINDYYIARELNQRASAIIDYVAQISRISPQPKFDWDEINRNYVLLVNELNTIYGRNQALQNIANNPETQPIWYQFDMIEGKQWDIQEYLFEYQNDAGRLHNAQVNRICIIEGNKSPVYAKDQKKIVTDTDVTLATLDSQLKDLMLGEEERNWFMPRYWFTYKIDGSVVINDVLTVRKTQPGLASDKLITEAVANEGKLIKPNLGKNYSRNLTTTLSGIGFKKNEPLQQLFFPTATNSGIVFRSQVTRNEADNEHINTYKLDEQLKKNGAITEEKPLDLNDIPF